MNQTEDMALLLLPASWNVCLHENENWEKWKTNSVALVRTDQNMKPKNRDVRRPLKELSLKKKKSVDDNLELWV